MAHEPLYYATYRGPDPAVLYVGDGATRRGYPAGQTVQIGKADADELRALLRQPDPPDVSLEAVPRVLIGTAEENQPSDPTAAAVRREAIESYLSELNDANDEGG